MIRSHTAHPAARTRALLPIGCGLTGLTLAVALRVHLAGVQGASSPVAGAVFGIALLLLTAACGMQRPKLAPRHVVWGVGAAAVFCVPPLLQRLVHGGVEEPAAALPLWAAVVTLVAVAEELFLRGALFEAAVQWRGERAAIVLTAVAFSLLHVPIYGWHVALLDLAVGVALGVLRVVAGSVSAPALAHVLADLAGWWLR
jgi:membrane protease YdiL (CAAX protease family)